MADMLGVDRREDKNNPAYQSLLTGNIPSVDTSVPNWWRYAAVMGELKKADGKKSAYTCEKYNYFLEAPFNISAKCCNVMKKNPAHKYSKETGRKPITAQMATESRLRTAAWLKNGCNGFHMKSPISNPMSFWTEQDVLAYIYINKLPICVVYGDVVPDKEIPEGVDISQLAIFDEGRPYFRTTGCNRTGCMFCGYGCHLEKPEDSRFARMKETHPKQYDYIMRPKEKGGLDYKNKIDWINEHGGTDIRY